ncbi:hypothetical protein [Nocardia sp. NPDC058666]
MFLRTAAPVDREQLLTALDTDVARLASWTVLHAARGGSGGEVGTTTTVARNLRALWTRTCVVAALLDVTAGESQTRWAKSVEAAADAITRQGLFGEQITEQWRAIVHVDMTRYRIQATALGEAGIDTDPSIGPPRPDTAIAAMRAEGVGPIDHISHHDVPTSGAQIAEAVEVAMRQTGDLDQDPLMQPPTFSDPPIRYPGAEL